MFLQKACISVAIILGIVAASAQQDTIPKLGLALSGGGAKGLAHIGVLKVLEEEGIYPDFITGTSMGSIVGGLYAIGYSPAELEKLAKKLTWDYYFTDGIPRTYKPIEEKNSSERYQFTFEIEDNKLQIPRGLIQGDKLVLMLARLTAPVHGIDNFDDFPIPFRAVAMDLETGEAVIFKDGSLVDAIRASMSIPSIFEPVLLNDRLLADGGWVRNLPVQDVLEMGADSVIAVDVGGALYKKDEITSVISVLDQTASYRIIQSTAEQIALSNLVIQPDIAGLSSLDFARVDSIIARGEAAARKMLPELRRLKANMNWTAARKPARDSVPFPSDINIIEVNTSQSSANSGLLKLCQLNTPAKYSLEEIEEAVTRLYALDFYDQLRYQLLSCGDGYELYFSGEEKSNPRLRIGVGYDSDYKAALLLNLSLRNWLLNSSRFSLDVRFSENPALLGEYLLYTRARPSVGLKLNGKLNFYPGLYYENGQLQNTFGMQHNNLQLEFLSGVTNNFYISAGIGLEQYFQRPKLFLASSEKVRLNQQYIAAQAMLDTYNRLYYPTSGSQLNAVAKLAFHGKLKRTSTDEKSIQSTNGGLAIVRFTKIFPLGQKEKMTLHWFSAMGTVVYKENNFINLLYLGRSLPYEETHAYFAGYRLMERPASSYVYSGLRWQWEPWQGYFGSLVFNYGGYAVASFNFDGNENNVITVEDDGNMSGVGIELGMLTRFGPLRVTTEYNFEYHDFNFIVRGGYAF